MKVSRRDLLAGAAGVVALGKTAAMQAPRPRRIRPRSAANRAGRSASGRRPKSRSASRAAPRRPARRIRISTARSRRPICTSSGITAASPRSIRRAYSLLIHGMVERPMVFTLADLKRFPAVSRVHFLECSGNFGGRGTATDLTPQQIAGLTSTSEWTGVPLATLFREVGASPKATWFLAEGQDAAVLTRSVPVVEGVRRCADRVRAERRSDPARAGISGAAVPARLGRQRQREVAAPHRAVGSPVHDARGNVEVHRSDGRRHGAHLQLPDGRALAHHLSGVSGDADAAAGSRSTASRGPDPERSGAST